MNQLLSKVAVRAWQSKTENNAAETEARSGRRRLLVVGVGSAGCAAVEWIFEDSPEASTLAINTDRISLEIHKSETKLLLGAKIFHGRGAQGHADAVERAAREAHDELAKLTSGFEIVAILTALGGGTGTGAAHVIARVARTQGAAVVAVAVLPFKAERNRRERAMQAFGHLKREAHTTILLDSEALLPVAGHLPIGRALGIMDYFMAEVPRSLSRTLAQPRRDEQAVVDARSALLAGGVGTICYAEWGAEGVGSAVHHPLSQATGGSPTSALIHIDSYDGRAPDGQERLLGGVAARLGVAPVATSQVYLLVQRDPALQQGGRAISIVTGLHDPCARAEVVPSVTLEPSRTASPPSAPEVREAAGSAPLSAAAPDAPGALH